ncbi:MAG: hypothetical protein NTZ39_05485 [Methanoregula sp.]|nr:hypothetical protein [Methanoregula sp.]
MRISSDSTTPIRDYVQSAIAQIKDAIPLDARIDGIINIRMTTVVQKAKGGGIDLQVLNMGADVSANQTQEITIPIRILTETGQAVEDAMKAEAVSRKAKAEADRKLEEMKSAALSNPAVQPSHGVRHADSYPGALPGLR